MQSVSSRIWTHVAVSISYNDNHYTTGTSAYLMHGAKPRFHYILTWKKKVEWDQQLYED